MSARIAYSKKATGEAVAEVCGQLGALQPKLLVVFASPRHDLTAVNEGMRSAFPGIPLLGCSTAGEIVSGAMLEGALVAMAVDEETIEDAAVALIADLRDPAALDEALASLEQHFGQPMRDMDMERYVGLVLIDGLSLREEPLMDRLGDRTDVLFVGGAAGDDLAFRQTLVTDGSDVRANAAVLAVLKPRRGFEILKTQSFRSLQRALVATRVDEDTRSIHEFNGRPAAEVYAELLGVTMEQLPSRFMRNPLGLMVGDEPYVRSPQRLDGTGIVFYCQIREGMQLDILESLDIVEESRRALAAVHADAGHAAALLNFNCILRTLELTENGRLEDYGRLFEPIPTIGFSTYGEEYLGHINQTATMLILR